MAYFLRTELQNSKRNKSNHWWEIGLFEQMLLTFKNHYHATVIVKKTHQQYVEFGTTNLGTGASSNIVREISDLHIIAYSPRRGMARETYLQAKVARGKDGLQQTGSFNFHADYYQYDLLSRRPLVYPPKNPRNRPYYRCYLEPDFLSNAFLPSIGSYGVFYEDKHRMIDFAYQPANLLQPMAGFSRRYAMQHTLPTYGSVLGIPDLQYTCSADQFEYAVTNMLLGSPYRLTPIRYECMMHPWQAYPYGLAEQYALNILNGNSWHLIDEVIQGLSDFRDFVYINREKLMKDNKEGMDSFVRYRELEEDMKEVIPEPVMRKESNGGDYERGENYGGLCGGSVNLLILNVDKIERNLH